MRCSSIVRHLLIYFVLSVFKVNGRQKSIVRMLVFWVVKHLDVFKNILSCLIPCFVSFVSDFLSFEQLKETFRNGVVMAIATSAR